MKSVKRLLAVALTAAMLTAVPLSSKPADAGGTQHCTVTIKVAEGTPNAQKITIGKVGIEGARKLKEIQGAFIGKCAA